MIRFFENVQGCLAVMSSSKDGNMRPLMEENYANRTGFLIDTLGINPDNTASIIPVHGGKVKLVSENHSEQYFYGCDGLVTKLNNTFLSVTNGDCPTIFGFYDGGKENRIVGIAHAGRKGLASGIIHNLFEAFTQCGGEDKSCFRFAISPGIGVCHYFFQQFIELDFQTLKYHRSSIVRSNNPSGYYLDLKAVITSIIKSYGIDDEQIEDKFECTFCTKDEKPDSINFGDYKFFSYRREKLRLPRVMMGVIGLA